MHARLVDHQPQWRTRVDTVTRTLCLIVLLLMHGLASAGELGRLFLSPADRTAIDAARLRLKSAPGTPMSRPDDGARTARPRVLDDPAETVTVNGYVARSAGAPTVWINGRDTAPGKLSAPARDGQRIRVPLAHGAGQVALKPGQSFDSGSRQVSDAYEQRPRTHE